MAFYQSKKCNSLRYTGAETTKYWCNVGCYFCSNGVRSWELEWAASTGAKMPEVSFKHVWSLSAGDPRLHYVQGYRHCPGTFSKWALNTSVKFSTSSQYQGNLTMSNSKLSFIEAKSGDENRSNSTNVEDLHDATDFVLELASMKT